MQLLGESSTATLRRGITLQIVLLIFIAALPIVGFGGFVMLRFYEGQQIAVERELFRRSNALAVTIDQVILQQTRVLETLAGSDELDSRDLAGFYRDARRASAQNPEWAGLALIDPRTGHQLVNTSQPFGSELPNARDLASLSLAASTRRPVIVAEPEERGLVTGAPIVGVRVPVIRNGEVRYVLSVLLKISALQDSLAAQKMPETWTAAVLDQEGTIIARNRRSETFVGQAATEDLRAAIAREDQGIFRATTQEGTPVYTVFQRSPLTEWVVALGIPVAEVEPLRQGIGLGLFASGLASISAAALIVFLLSRIIIQRRESEARQRHLQETERALAEKDVLLREIHHRVKNNLQMMASMTRIVARGVNPESQPVLYDITQRIEALGAAYSEIHNADDLHRLDLAAYVGQISLKVANGFGAKNIELQTCLATIRANIDTALPVGLIANELVTNAFKHGFPEGRNGKVLVRLEQRRQSVAVLTVADTGIGLPGAQTEAVGLKLAKALAGQVNGRIYVAVRPQRGTQFRLVFRLLQTKLPLSQTDNNSELLLPARQ